MTMDEMLTEVIGSRDVVQRDRFLDQGHPLMPQPVARNGNAQRVSCSPSADRVRLSRARHKRHERVVPIEVRDSEIAALVTHGFLAPDRTDDLRDRRRVRPIAGSNAAGAVADGVRPPGHSLNEGNYHGKDRANQAR